MKTERKSRIKKIRNLAISFFVLIVGLGSGLFLPSELRAYSSPGSPQGYINDFANILSPSTKSSIEADLKSFEASTTIEIAVATVNSLNGDDIASYANNLFREWGIGKKGSDNGILLLIALEDRKLRIEVGYGLEGVLPDIQAGYIIDNIITPEFKKGDYDQGVLDGVEAIKKVVSGEKFDVGIGSTSKFSADTLAIILFIGFIFIQWFGAILARSKSWWLGGVLGGVGGIIVGSIFGFIFIGILAIVGFSFLGSLFDYFVSKSYKKHKSSGSQIPWYIGGHGGSGSGGSSFGGFGGGSSGGGGASGGW